MAVDAVAGDHGLTLLHLEVGQVAEVTNPESITPGSAPIRQLASQWDGPTTS